MIKFENLHIRHGEKIIINNLSFNAKPGDKIAFKGRSGSGKTSILNAIMGFQPISGGNIFINHHSIQPESVKLVRSQTAWVPQELSFDLPTVRDLLLLPFSLRKNRLKRPDTEKIISTLGSLDLQPEILNQPLHHISGGEKQRICLASALMQNKPIIILDEPTSALDSEGRKKVTRLFCSLTDTTVIAASHDDYWLEQSNIVIDLESI